MSVTTYQDSEFKHGLPLSNSCKLNERLFDVISVLMKNQTLVKLLTVPTNDPFKSEDIIINKDNPIINKYIFPYPKDFNTTNTKGSRIYVNWAKGRGSNAVFEDMILQIDILVSGDSDILLMNGGRRDLEIKHEVEKTLTGSHGLGLGELNDPIWEMVLVDNMVGYSLSYFIKEFR